MNFRQLSYLCFSHPKWLGLSLLMYHSVLAIKSHVLYFTMFYYILLYFTLFCYILLCFLLYFTIFYYILLYFIMFYYILLHFTVFYMQSLTIFYYILLCFTIFYYIYQLLHQYHKILAAFNIQRERACEFSFNIAQSQYFVVLM